MSNAVNKPLKIILSAFTVMNLLSSCSSDSDKEKAACLLNEATAALDSGKYTEALELTDSIKRAYPSAIDARRQSLHIAARATEGLTLQRLQQADSIVAELGAKGDSLQKLIKFVNNPIEGYYVGVGSKPGGIVGGNGIQARISPDGDFYMISSLKAKTVKSTSVTVNADGQSASTLSVPHDGERNDRSMGAEVITFMGVECDSVGHFIYLHRNSPMTITFNGSSTYSMTLPEAQVSEIATLYEYATTVRRAKLACIEKERLTRALDIARSQAAKTYVTKETSDEK